MCKCEECGKELSNIELAEVEISDEQILCIECRDLDKEIKSVKKSSL